MVIKRSDLAKQFELVVQQEIINHNKQIEATNQALQKMQKQINDLVQDHASHIARLETYVWDLDTNYKDLKKKHEKLVWRLETYEKQTDESFEKISFDLNMRIDYVEDTVCDIEEDTACIEELQNTVSLYEGILEKQKFYIHTEFYNLKKSCQQMFTEFKNEIEERPSEIPLVREQLEVKISDAIIDAKGVLRELEVAKKEAFVMQKKIEQIYALLGRNKEGGEL